MSDEYAFSPDRATLENLDALYRETGIINEQRMLELWDIAVSAISATSPLIEGGLSAYEAISLVNDGLSFGKYSGDDENSPLGVASVGVPSGIDRAVFSELFVKAAAEKGYRLGEADLLAVGTAPSSFAYVRNRFSDEAFDVFSQDFDNPTVTYRATFKECAELLDRGDVGYCLFPLEERGGVRLPTVSELVLRYDFKISAVTPVFGFDGDADLKYALISKHFTIPERLPLDDRYLEIRLAADKSGALSELLSAATYFGMTAYRVNTVTLDNEGESTSYFSIVLREGEGSFAAILVYIALFAPDASAVGVYKNLE